MTEIADRYRKVASGFTERVNQVAAGDWDRPSPCDGWSARDVVRHLCDTAQMFLGRVGVDAPDKPSVDDDPVGAWLATRDAVQAALDDPEVASREYESPMGTNTLERGIAFGPRVEVPDDADEQTQLIAFTGRRP